MSSSRSSRNPRFAATARFLFIALLMLMLRGVEAASAVTGTIVDTTGRSVPRAFVRALDAQGREVASAFADDAGHFDLDVSDAQACRIEVTLTGFETASTPCTVAPLRVVVAVAPIHETVIVTAT